MADKMAGDATDAQAPAVDATDERAKIKLSTAAAVPEVTVQVQSKDVRPLTDDEIRQARSAVALNPKDEAIPGPKKDTEKLTPPANKDVKPVEAQDVKESSADQYLKALEKQRQIEKLKAESPILSPTERNTVNILRANLISIAPIVSVYGIEDKLDSDSGKKAPADWAKLSYTEVLDRLNKLEKAPDGVSKAFMAGKFLEAMAREQEAGVYGPATKTALGATLDWFQKKELPKVMTVANILGVLPEPNAPLEDKDGSELSQVPLDVLSTLLANGIVKANVGIDASKTPTVADLAKFESSFKWLNTMKEKLVTVQMNQAETEINSQIDELGLSQSWKRQEGQDQAAFIQAATRDLKIAIETRNHIESMLNLYKASEGKFQLELPPKTRITLEHEGKAYQFTENDINAGKVPEEIQKALIYGSLKGIKLDLPTDHAVTPENESKRAAFIGFLEKVSPRVTQAVLETAKARENQDSILLAGDVPIASSKAIFAKIGLERALLGSDEIKKELLGADKREALYQEYLKSDSVAVSKDLRPAIIAGLKWLEANDSQKFDFRTPTKEFLEAVKAQLNSEKHSATSSIINEIRQIIEQKEKPGKLVAAASDKDKASANQLLLPATLRSFDFTANTIESGPNKGKIEVVQRVQVWQGGTMSYLDARPLMSSVGDNTVVEKKVLAPTDLVPVRDGASLKLIMAKDLQSFHASQVRSYYGHKALTVGMDGLFGAMAIASMVPTMGASGPEAVVAAQIAKASIRKTILRDVIWDETTANIQLAKQAKNILLAGTGVFNNTAGNQMKWGDVPIGQYINNGRMIIFTADIALGLGAQALQKIKDLPQIYERLGELALASNTVPDIMKAYALLSNGSFKASELSSQLSSIYKSAAADLNKLFAPIERTGPISGEHVIHEVFMPFLKESGSPFWPAVQNYAGKGFFIATAGMMYSFYGPDGEVFRAFSEQPEGNAMQDAVNLYGEAYKTIDTKSFKGNPQVKAESLLYLAKKVSDAISGPQAPEQKAKFESLANEIKAALGKDSSSLEKTKERLLSSLNSTDKNLATYSALALMFMSRDSAGNVPDKLGTEKWSVSREMLAEKLKSELFSQTLESGISSAFGEAMVDLGLISSSNLSGLYLQKLDNPSTSDEEKQIAISSLASALIMLKAESLKMSTRDKQEAATRNFGLTFDDVQNKLAQIASGRRPADAAAQSPQIRSMAAYALAISREPEAKKIAENLDWLASLSKTSAKDGISGSVVEKLQHELTQTDKADVPKDLLRYRLLQSLNAYSLIQDLDPKAKENKLMLQTLPRILESKNSAVITSLSELSPRVLSPLKESNPELAKQLLASMINFGFGPSRNSETEKSMISLMDKTKKLILAHDTSLLPEFEEKLLSLIDPRSKSFAASNATLRSNAIATLAELGSSKAIDALRLSAALEPYELNGTTINAHESNASVRLAAIKALEARNDPEFSTLISALTAKEKDIPTKQVLSIFERADFTPGSKDLDLYANAALANLRMKFPHLSNFDANTAQAWLKAKFELLDVNQFRKNFEAAARSGTSWVDRQLAPNQYLEFYERKAAASIVEQQQRQFDDLLKLSKGNDADADRARMALFYIATQNAYNLTQGGTETNVRGQFYRGVTSLESLQEKAANALSENCRPGSHSQALSQALSEIGVKSTDARVRAAFLSAFANLEDSGRIESVPKLKAILSEELARPQALQSKVFQEQLLKIVGKLPFRVAEPVLETFINTSPFHEIKQTAAFYYPGPTRMIRKDRDDPMTFQSEDAKAWLREHFKLVDLQEYIKAYNAAAEQSTSWSERNIPHTLRWLWDYTSPTVEDIERKAGISALGERRNQFYQLLELAGKDSDAESMKAQYALYFIANNSGFIMGKDKVKFELNGNYYSGESFNRDFQLQAAKRLVSIFQRSKDSNSELARLILDGLNNANEAEVRLQYLKGLSQAGEKQEGELSKDTSASAEIIGKAILSELRRPPAIQDAKFQMALIDNLKSFPEAQRKSLLQILKEKATKEEVRKHAGELLEPEKKS